ncbi:MAG: hypothetical protein ACP59X_19840 [Solidesulfovibrio sp. DCME]|uniref:hypothetical protein n=1 Tax=Solidesulfovibrio sp. DCME TaxID=3447380 RepID=UPI003D12F9C1
MNIAQKTCLDNASTSKDPSWFQFYLSCFFSVLLTLAVIFWQSYVGRQTVKDIESYRDEEIASHVCASREMAENLKGVIDSPYMNVSEASRDDMVSERNKNIRVLLEQIHVQLAALCTKMQTRNEDRLKEAQPDAKPQADKGAGFHPVKP